MWFLWNFLKGSLIGIAVIIPGFSGGTVAVLLDVYDELIDSISNFRKHVKKSLKFLIPLLLGLGVFALLTIKPITWGLTNYPLITVTLFAGLLVGGIPSFTTNLKGNPTKKNYWFILGGLLIILAIIIPSLFTGGNMVSLINPPIYMYFLLVLVGVIASIALILPGISGSMILLLIGLYVPLMDTIKGFVASLFNLPTNIFGFSPGFNTEVLGTSTYIWQSLLLLVCFGVGILLGVIFVSKVMNYCLRRFKYQTYFVIFGFIIGSIVGLYTSTPLNTNLNLITIIISVLFFILGFTISFIPGLLVQKKKKVSKNIVE